MENLDRGASSVPKWSGSSTTRRQTSPDRGHPSTGAAASGAARQPQARPPGAARSDSSPGEPCPVVHKSETHVVGCSGRIVAAVPRRSEANQKRRWVTKRGLIRGWSRDSRRRLMFGVGCIDFRRVREKFGGAFVSVTVTYRDDPGPELFRRHRLKLLDRLRYELGERRLVWKVEFQRRGVVHLHLLVWVPFDDAEGLRSFRLWLWSAWEGITGERLRVDARWTTAQDLARYISADWTMDRKAYQYRVPATWSHVGRWWGIVDLPAEWTTVAVDQETFVFARRTLRRYRQSKSRYKVRCGRSQGLTTIWALGDDYGSLERALLPTLLARAGP